MKNILKTTLRNPYKLLKPPCRRGQKESFLFLKNPYKLLKPPGRRGQKETFLSLRNPYKLLKLFNNFTPPPPLRTAS